jgi:long-chain fatty acid transport protein
MQPFRQPVSSFLIIIGLSLSQALYATNGFFPHGIGTKNKSMAGAGMALPEDAISIVNNPAVAAFLENRMDIGLTAFMPNRNYTILFGGNNGWFNSFSIGPQSLDSNKDLYLGPEIAQTRKLQNNSAFAWAFYMRNGMGASYRGGSATFDPDGDGPLGITTLPGTYGDGTASLELMQGFVDISWAKRWDDQMSFGISAVLAAQSLEVTGAGDLARYTKTFADSNGTQAPDKLSGNGRDVNYGVGLKLGLHRLLGDHLTAGIMYQARSSSGRPVRWHQPYLSTLMGRQ